MKLVVGPWIVAVVKFPGVQRFIGEPPTATGLRADSETRIEDGSLTEMRLEVDATSSTTVRNARHRLVSPTGRSLS